MRETNIEFILLDAYRAGARHSSTRSAAASAAAQHESCSQQQHRTTLESNRRRVRNEERASNTTPGDTPAAGGAWGLVPRGSRVKCTLSRPLALVPRRSSKVESTAIGIPYVNSPRSITIYATRTSHNKQHHSHHDPTSVKSALKTSTRPAGALCDVPCPARQEHLPLHVISTETRIQHRSSYETPRAA